ncbi:MAG: DNA polymerase IV [bacterium]
MSEFPFTLHSYPCAIIHFDGDAFFTSVEQSIHPYLKGQPVVTGKERGIIACASYEAKALGISRGLSLYEAIRMCPKLKVLPSDYETYSLYSKRMFDIARRYTPMVEEYSIDEGFADLTGLRRVHHASYEEIALRIQAEIQAELDITVSVGLSLTKSLAKLGSKYRKPRGFTAIPGTDIEGFLKQIPLEKVWGFGPNTVALLTKHGLRTVHDFAIRPEGWADRLMGKIGRELWGELRGTSLYPVTTEAKSSYCSISKCKTFTAPSTDPEFIWAKLVRNVESAFIKARRYRLRARQVSVMLRRQDYRQEGLEIRLSRAVSVTRDAMPAVREMFDQLIEQGAAYRATMVVLGKLEPDKEQQFDLFEDPVQIEKRQALSAAVDAVNEQYGKHTLSFAPSLFLNQGRQTARDEQPQRKSALIPGETRRQRLRIPRLFLKV